MNSVLITGGTGSLGRALTKYILENNLSERIVVYSRGEHKQEQMKSEFNSDKLRFFIGDVRDKDRLALAVRGCSYIVHAAALKIVPAGEYNPMEFIKTNVIGAQNLVNVVVSGATGLQNNYARVIGISTDKAVNPMNLYGATKLCMEKLLLASNSLVGSHQDIQFVVCRYGNVANSQGSVIQKFKECYDRDEPFPITDERMTRYWIELDEAAKFVYSIFGKIYSVLYGGDDPRIFIPDMPSFNIMDLVKAFSPYSTWPITKIGIRPGEKIHEQLDENRFSSTNERFLSWQDIHERLKQLGVVTS